MSKILDAEDILARARDLIECASCTAAHVWGKEADHVDSALEIAGEKVGEAIALLDEYRTDIGAGPQPAPDAKPASRPARTKRGGK
jgi:hypothetical protein